MCNVHLSLLRAGTGSYLLWRGRALYSCAFLVGIWGIWGQFDQAFENVSSGAMKNERNG